MLNMEPGLEGTVCGFQSHRLLAVGLQTWPEEGRRQPSRPQGLRRGSFLTSSKATGPEVTSPSQVGGRSSSFVPAINVAPGWTMGNSD